MKNTREEPGEMSLEKAKEETRTLLRKLMAADDVIRIRYRKGELSREKASKFYGCIAVVVDGIMLEALRNKEIAEAIAPVLLDKIENGWGHPALDPHSADPCVLARAGDRWRGPGPGRDTPSLRSAEEQNGSRQHRGAESRAGGRVEGENTEA